MKKKHWIILISAILLIVIVPMAVMATPAPKAACEFAATGDCPQAGYCSGDGTCQVNPASQNTSACSGQGMCGRAYAQS